MLNWLKQQWNSFTGGLDDLYHWILQTLQTIYSFIDDELTSLWNSAVQLYNASIAFAQSVLDWAAGEVTSIYVWATGWINYILQWAAGAINDVRNWIASVAAWATQELDRLWNWATSTIASLITWVLQNIWDPLWNAITGAIRWIEQYGYYILNLILHPELLAAIIGQALLAVWMALAQKFARPFAHWLFSSLMGSLDFAAGIIEDMISAIL